MVVLVVVVVSGFLSVLRRSDGIWVACGVVYAAVAVAVAVACDGDSDGDVGSFSPFCGREHNTIIIIIINSSLLLLIT